MGDPTRFWLWPWPQMRFEGGRGARREERGASAAKKGKKKKKKKDFLDYD